MFRSDGYCRNRFGRAQGGGVRTIWYPRYRTGASGQDNRAVVPDPRLLCHVCEITIEVREQRAAGRHLLVRLPLYRTGASGQDNRGLFPILGCSATFAKLRSRLENRGLLDVIFLYVSLGTELEPRSRTTGPLSPILGCSATKHKLG
ncbi:hypothetical protein J6590_008278 [Homalodisca vitripennis]|nr:hypothetical protein J6590_008278 [Homalodisca vitripennis]